MVAEGMEDSKATFLDSQDLVLYLHSYVYDLNLKIKIASFMPVSNKVDTHH